GQSAAGAAQEAFVAQFSRGELPDNIPEITIAAPPEGLTLARALKEAGLVPSTSEANRQIQQRAVRVNQERAEDRSLVLASGASYLLQVGSRRFARINLATPTE